MAEQFIKAYNVSEENLYKVVGCNDESFIKKMKENEDLAEEIDELIRDVGGRDFGFDDAIKDIINSKLNAERSYEYIRTLEVILEVIGDPHEEEVILAGRGWQDIGQMFSKWNLPILGNIWEIDQLSFPWKSEEKISLTDWPIAMILRKKNMNQLKQELKNFDSTLLKKYPLPERQNGLEEEIELMIETILQWLSRTDKDLILILDGQQ